MAIKVWNYLREYESEKGEIHAAIEEVLNSGILILGEKVKEFEEKFSSYCGVQYGIGVNSATDAIFLGLKALNIGAGDEVITVSNTAVPTVSAITATGAKAVFVDIDAETYLMNVDLVEKAITRQTKCIIPVHLFGQCVDIHKLKKITDHHKLFVLEDCAQSHGAAINNQMAGSFGDLSVFSFYPTKVLGGYGDGGMILTGNSDLYHKLRRLRFYGMEKTYYSLEQGYNSRLDELHASILLTKLKHIEAYIQRRRQLALQYNEHLKNTRLLLPVEIRGIRHVYYLYVVHHPERDRIIEELKNKDIYVNISYPWPVHIMPGFKNLGYKEGDLPVTEKMAKEIFSLPMYPSLTDDEQSYVIDSLKEILNKL